MAILKCTKRMVIRLRTDGDLHPVKVGRENRYLESEVYSYIRRRWTGRPDGDGPRVA